MSLLIREALRQQCDIRYYHTFVEGKYGYALYEATNKPLVFIVEKENGRQTDCVVYPYNKRAGMTPFIKDIEDKLASKYH